MALPMLGFQQQYEMPCSAVQYSAACQLSERGLDASTSTSLRFAQEKGGIKQCREGHVHEQKYKVTTWAAKTGQSSPDVVEK